MVWLTFMKSPDCFIGSSRVVKSYNGFSCRSVLLVPHDLTCMDFPTFSEQIIKGLYVDLKVKTRYLDLNTSWCKALRLNRLNKWLLLPLSTMLLRLLLKMRVFPSLVVARASLASSSSREASLSMLLVSISFIFFLKVLFILVDRLPNEWRLLLFLLGLMLPSLRLLD